MAGTPTPEPKPNLGWKATVAGLVFSATVLTGFGVATATNHEDTFKKKDDVVEADYEEGEDSHAEEGDSHDEGEDSHAE